MKEWLSGEKNKRMFETKVEALCGHLRLLGLNATTVKFNERLCVIGPIDQKSGITGWGLLGAVKVANRNVDLVELVQYAGADDYLYRCYYVVWAKVEGIEHKMKAKLKSSRKHLMSREIVDFWWDGNELAQALNSDTDLRDMLHRMKKVLRLRFLFPVLCLEVKLFRKHQGIRIMPKGDYYSPEAAFPSIETFETFDRVAQHIRSIADIHP